jgi:hypothetical protein
VPTQSTQAPPTPQENIVSYHPFPSLDGKRIALHADLRLDSGCSLTILERLGFQRIAFSGSALAMDDFHNTVNRSLKEAQCDRDKVETFDFSLGCGPVLLSLGNCIECLRQPKAF